jgi:hypothetical protein
VELEFDDLEAIGRVNSRDLNKEKNLLARMIFDTYKDSDDYSL